jgi:hypothetical protein
MQYFKTMVVTALAVLFVGVVIFFPNANFYLIREDSGGGELLWKNDEAYLFLYDAPDGFRLTGPELLAEPIREYLRAPALPANRKFSMIILHITHSGLNRYTQNSQIPISSFTPVGDTIYADCPGGVCKWTGNQFELITEDQDRQMGGMDGRRHLIDNRNAISDTAGWSKRQIRITGAEEKAIHDQFSVAIGPQVGIFVTEGNPASVELRRSGQSSERIWSYKLGTSIVSKAHYERIFE